MNLSKDKVTEIFYFADNFCKEFYKAIEIYAIEEGGKARRVSTACRLNHAATSVAAMLAVASY